MTLMRGKADGRAALTLLPFALLLACATPAAYGQRRAHARRVSVRESARFVRLIEANVVATHAYQVLLAKRSGRGDAACYSPGRLTDAELEAIVAHQASLLKSAAAAVRAWARVRASDFDPAKDIEPILNAGLAVPESAPVNVFTDYLRRRVKAPVERLRSVANLYQTILEVERDGDVLQDEFAFYIALGLPVYTGQFDLHGSDSAMLAAGRALARKSCASPFETDAAAWQIAGRKVWNWGEKHLHVRDEKTLAASLLRERDVRARLPRVRALPAQRVAVVGHSFTMGQHWSSPSSFVRVVTEIFRRENPRVEFRQFERGGLTASRAKERFYQGVLDWKPDKVLLVVLTRTEEDYAALREMGEGFRAAGIQALMFDDINDPESVKPGVGERAVRVAREAGVTVIEVGAALKASPERERFVSLDRVHMTEPYHRLMAKEWLRFLAGTGPSAADGRRRSRRFEFR
jgi:hypothetical protein